MRNPTFPSRICLLSLTPIFFGVLLSGCAPSKQVLGDIELDPDKQPKIKVEIGRSYVAKDSSEEELLKEKLAENGRLSKLIREGKGYGGLDDIMSEYFNKYDKEEDSLGFYNLTFRDSTITSYGSWWSGILNRLRLTSLFDGIPPYATDTYFLRFKLSFYEKVIGDTCLPVYSDKARFEIKRKHNTKDNAQEKVNIEMTRLLSEKLHNEVNKNAKEINGCLAKLVIISSGPDKDDIYKPTLSQLLAIKKEIANTEVGQKTLGNIKTANASDYDTMGRELKEDIEEYKAGGGYSISTNMNIDTKSKSDNTWLAVSLDVLGIAGLGYGFYQNSNAGLITGGILLASGITIHIWF